MKILLVGDLHIGANENNQKFISYQKKTIDWIFNISKQADCVLFLGDVFESRKKITAESIKLYLDKLRNNTTSYSLLGNHDVLHKNTNEVSILRMLGDLAFNQIFIDPLNFNDCCILPWITEDNKSDCLNFIRKTKSKFCLGHFELNGFKMSGNHKCENSNFDNNMLYKFDMVYSGHYHTYQRQGNITYLGACLELNWGDCEIDKKIVILDTETGKEEFFVNPNRLYEKIVINSDEFDFLVDNDKEIRVILNCEKSPNILKKLEDFEGDIDDNFSLGKMTDIGDYNVGEIEDIFDLWEMFISELNVEMKDQINNKFKDVHKRMRMEE